MGIKIGLDYFPPFIFAGIRFVIAAISLFVLLKIEKKELCLKWEKISPAVIFGALNGISYGLVYWGEQYISSGLASILNSVLPFFSAVIAYFLLKEPLNTPKIIGLVIGFSGILFIFSDVTDQFSSGNFMAKLVMIIAAFIFAFAGAHTKKYKVDLHPLQVVTVQMATSAIVLLAIGIPMEFNTEIILSLPGVMSLLYLSIFGSAIAFLMYYNLLLRIEVSKVAYINFITPPAAVLIGALFLNEPINLRAIGGLVIIFIGLAIINYNEIAELKKDRKSVHHS
jgi:drug/metabolite transporter (DMT)-like permease